MLLGHLNARKFILSWVVDRELPTIYYTQKNCEIGD